MPASFIILIAVASIAVIVLVYLYPIRSWCRNWGANDEEVNNQMPGDEEVSRANNIITQHTILL